MSDYPQSWIEVALSEISTIEMGQSPPSSTYNEQGIGLPFFQGKAEFGKLYPTPQKWCTQPKKIAEADDILLSVRAPVGPTNLAVETCCIGRGLAAIRAYSPVSQKFVLHYFRNLESWLTQQGTGSTFSAISGGFIRELDFPLPPLNEQHHIANKLDTLLAHVDSCQTHLDRIPQILKRFRQSVLAAAISGRLTEDWREGKRLQNSEQVKLGDWCDVLGGKRLPKGFSLEDENTGFPYIRVTDFDNYSVNTNHVKFLPSEAAKHIERYIINSSDVYISIAGSVGIVGQVPEDLSGSNLTENAARIVVREGFNPKYVMYQLASPNLKEQIERKKIATTQEKLGLFRIKELLLWKPFEDEQAEIVRRIEELFAHAENLEERYYTASERIEQITPSLLAKAFRGELVDQDPNDEPASKLLERIRSSRELIRLENKAKKTNQANTMPFPKEAEMLKRTEIQPDHLTSILKARGPLSAESLWIASQLDIDEFYEQLKVEETKGLLREIRESDETSPRLLEAL